MAARRSRVFVKITRGLQQIEHVVAHVKYVGFRSREAGEKGFFSRDEDRADYKAFVDRVKQHPALRHSKTIKVRKMIFSLREKDYQAYKRSGKNFRDLVRNTLHHYERKHGVRLDWVANIHEAEGHPHAHVIIKAVSDVKDENGRSKRIVFRKDDLQEIKQVFEQELERDARYHWYERLDLEMTMMDMARSFEGVTKQIKRDIERVQLEAEYEKRRNQEKGRGRS